MLSKSFKKVLCSEILKRFHAGSLLESEKNTSGPIRTSYVIEKHKTIKDVSTKVVRNALQKILLDYDITGVISKEGYFKK